MVSNTIIWLGWWEETMTSNKNKYSEEMRMHRGLAARPTQAANPIGCLIKIFV